MSKEQIELTRQDLIVGHVYEAKRKQVNPYREINDRQILWIGKEFYKDEYQEVVQYDSPTVRSGQNYPKVSVIKFLKWAKSDVTVEMPKGEWRIE
ncbi:hypothetical protein A4G16_02430 [Mannheimia granulomatis]|uniref:Uncharacterized protein n=1 Tax=Mannheimia granulomatis TaxID=85402 RepID=A0A6G8JGV3_9PAST|nr:hypothetical protein [Mannheimia granulomatis]QIM66309.1 hypothetical protein A4G16_02430 [Mannheimia granulomatis]